MPKQEPEEKEKKLDKPSGDEKEKKVVDEKDQTSNEQQNPEEEQVEEKSLEETVADVRDKEYLAEKLVAFEKRNKAIEDKLNTIMSMLDTPSSANDSSIDEDADKTKKKVYITQ